ncbi:MalY/PatB family protein [Nakamurella endophytica]|uniref:cysteine-S-conjugate beta-lyase n=1 Tax=Nakamurella endophytica TaxID=1748367 RepID=A0A917ST28_9ACTN|nr:aminotransferase class I/II-fold pyridoxal phosphate-dependent enzyme [Nakamurella endophytica]GGL95592.1 cystathionine beta-lyase [Nakamurella endophytica]
MPGPFDIPLAALRQRTSAKWTTYGVDVLPLPVAEMDVRLADPVARVLHEAVDRSDTGYAGDPGPVRRAFAAFADRRWGWPVSAEDVRTCPDVAAGVMAVLRVLTRPGDGVVVMPPVYPPFFAWVRTVGATPVEVPLTGVDGGGRIDLAGVERALAAGTRVVLLCHPHNPTGAVHPAADLVELAALADRFGATVLSDEIHAPLAHPGSGFRPFLTLGAAAERTGVAFGSASKAWNLAGLKCALVTAGSGRRDVLEALPPELGWAVGQFGQLAARAAFDEGEAWLDEVVAGLVRNADLLGELLLRHLPGVRSPRPAAGYLAWLDCRALGLGDDPAQVFLDRAGVALHHGPDFGAQGAGWARINVGCPPDLLTEAVRRMAAAVAGRSLTPPVGVDHAG